MTIEYTWRVNNLEYTNDADRGVTTVHWEVNGLDTQTNNRGRYYTSSSFTPDPTAEGYTPFAQLTEQGVLDWIRGSEDVDVEQIEETVARQIREQNEPKTVSGLPW